jgi:hypothetical protein
MNFLTRSSRAGRFAFAFVLWPLSLLASDFAQMNQPVRSPDTPVLIWDIDLKVANEPPRNWRTTDEPLKPGTSEAAPAIFGLRDLRASGSGEFTPEGLKLVLARTRGPVTVFDLRQETHIFVNALPSAGMRHAIGQTPVELRATLKPTKLRGWRRLSPGAKLIFDRATR